MIICQEETYLLPIHYSHSLQFSSEISCAENILKTCGFYNAPNSFRIPIQEVIPEIHPEIMKPKSDLETCLLIGDQDEKKPKPASPPPQVTVMRFDKLHT